MGWSEARLMQLIANAEQNGTPQDIPHFREQLEALREQSRLRDQNRIPQ